MFNKKNILVYKHGVYQIDINISIYEMAQWLERSPRERKVVGSIPDRVIPKTLLKIVPDASLLGAQHIRTGLASLSSQTSFKKEMDTIRNERSCVIYISGANLFRNRP